MSKVKDVIVVKISSDSLTDAKEVNKTLFSFPVEIIRSTTAKR